MEPDMEPDMDLTQSHMMKEHVQYENVCECAEL